MGQCTTDCRNFTNSCMGSQEVVLHMGEDDVDILKKKFPFYQIDVKEFVAKVNTFETDLIDISELSKKFQTLMWTKGDHWATNSELRKLLWTLPRSQGDSV